MNLIISKCRVSVSSVSQCLKEGTSFVFQKSKILSCFCFCCVFVPLHFLFYCDINSHSYPRSLVFLLFAFPACLITVPAPNEFHLFCFQLPQSPFINTHQSHFPVPVVVVFMSLSPALFPSVSFPVFLDLLPVSSTTIFACRFLYLCLLFVLGPIKTVTCDTSQSRAFKSAIVPCQICFFAIIAPYARRRCCATLNFLNSSDIPRTIKTGSGSIWTSKIIERK